MTLIDGRQNIDTRQIDKVVCWSGYWLVILLLSFTVTILLNSEISTRHTVSGWLSKYDMRAVQLDHRNVSRMMQFIIVLAAAKPDTNDERNDIRRVYSEVNQYLILC